MSLFISIIAFVLILAVLVIVHEFGHFIVAKKSGIKVEEFGFGFPPRVAKLFTWKGTVFTLNWIPFGGFVKIFGENGEDVIQGESEKKQSFVHKSKWTQAAVLFAGPLFNIIFAWILLSFLFFVGSPALVTEENKNYIQDKHIAVVEVLENSPASNAGILIGDTIISASYSTKESIEITNSEDLTSFIKNKGTQQLSLVVERKNTEIEFNLTPEFGLFENQNTPALGVVLDSIGTLQLPIHKALWSGIQRTWNLTEGTAVFLFDLIKGLVSGDKTNLSGVTGPVGIVPVVGDALSIGFSFVIIITALISINLAIINLLPFPALDGGRLLFVFIEVIKGSPINPKIASWLNTIGFFVLIALMILVTIRDIIQSI